MLAESKLGVAPTHVSVSGSEKLTTEAPIVSHSSNVEHLPALMLVEVKEML